MNTFMTILVIVFGNVAIGTTILFPARCEAIARTINQSGDVKWTYETQHQESLVEDVTGTNELSVSVAAYCIKMRVFGGAARDLREMRINSAADKQ